MTAPALSRSFRPALAAAATLAAALAGCDLEWDKPDLSAPPPARFIEAKPHPQPPISGGRDFAVKFGSKELTGLVERALDDNLDLAAAIARITQADAQARISSAAQWPSVSMTDIARTTRTPGTTINVGSASSGFNPSTTSSSTSTSTSSSGFRARNFGFFQLGLTASYEVDFWGKNEDASMAGRILANVSRFDRDVVEISTVAAVLNAYFQVLTAQDRLRIAHQNVTIAQQVMDAINARLEVGVATVLDTSQQLTILAQQQATIPPLEQTLRQTRNNLAVLLGQTPESMTIRGGSLNSVELSSDCAGPAVGSAATPPRRGRGGSATRVAGIFSVAGAGRLFPISNLDQPLWLPERAALDAAFAARRHRHTARRDDHAAGVRRMESAGAI